MQVNIKNILNIYLHSEEYMLYSLHRRRRLVMSTKKEENFIRLAENRTNKIISMLRLLGNLSNTSNYSYNSSQVNAIFDAIVEEVNLQKKRFVEIQEPRKKFKL